MRIGIDARFIGRPGGIGRYTEELVRRLSLCAARHEFFVFLRDEGLRRLGDWSPKNVTKRRAEIPWYGLAEQIRLPGLIDRAQLDLVHFPHWNVPLRIQTPFVLTIHDLLILEHPTARATTWGPVVYAIKRSGHRAVLSQAIRRARRIIVPSEFVKQSIVVHFPQATARTVVIPEGVSTPPPLPPSLEGREKREGEFQKVSILYVGNAYPHKNVERLLSAFAMVRETLPGATLTIAGYDDYFFQRLRQFAHKRGLAQNVSFIPSPQDDTLEGLYRAAEVLIMPSETEGFGLPPLEAMARGVPVVSSTGGSLPEVLGDAASFFNPHNTAEMASALKKVLTDSAYREILRTRGRERARRYSWEETARNTMEIYEQEERQRGN